MHFKFRNVNEAYPRLVGEIKRHGREVETRNGPALRFQEPVMWTIENPIERVLFDPGRDANPFFHMFEGLWMIAGSNSVAPLAHFTPRILEYSDDGATLSGAYGHRWQEGLGLNQIHAALLHLKDHPKSRRCVLSMWSPISDWRAIMRNGKDIPCNTQIMLTIREPGQLNMFITNRSNDLVWGALGANVVHFSMVLEYLANMLDCDMGEMTTVSNDLHMYMDHVEKYPEPTGQDPYKVNVTAYPFGEATNDFASDVNSATRIGWSKSMSYKTDWFMKVFRPAMRAYRLYKARKLDEAQEVMCYKMAPCDWRIACRAWMARR